MTRSGDEQSRSAGDITLASYEAASERYLRHSSEPGADVPAFLDAFADLVGTGTVLELGSGPGRDAAHLETRGVHVVRTDGARCFVDRLRAAGHDAQLLDIRSEHYGVGRFDAVLADAVLLHLSRDGFVRCLQTARKAVRSHGVLGMTLKEGDGEGWSTAKLDLPRHFTYWRESGVRAALAEAGWRVLSIDQVAGRSEPWLFVLAAASEAGFTAVR